jgi:hypothetical protein
MNRTLAIQPVARRYINSALSFWDSQEFPKSHTRVLYCTGLNRGELLEVTLPTNRPIYDRQGRLLGEASSHACLREFIYTKHFQVEFGKGNASAWSNTGLVQLQCLK